MTGPPPKPRSRAAYYSLALSLSFLTAAADAHVMSTSQGTLSLAGHEVRYELEMPLYEISEVESPQTTLLAAFQVTSDGHEPTQTSGNCSEQTDDSVYVCNASFVFEEAPRTVNVRCDYPAVTVPNHVHILRSGEGDLSRQTMFDIASPEAEIRFVEPTSLEVFWTQFNAGLRRVLINPVLVLFLLALTVSARTRRESQSICGAFVAVEVVAAMVFRTGIWSAPARFVEAAGALTIAYLAVEILLLPEAGKRWLIAGGLGLFHGLFFGGFLVEANLRPIYFLSGVVLCEVLALAMLGAIWRKARTRRHEQLAALLLLVVGLGWFFVRLQG